MAHMARALRVPAGTVELEGDLQLPRRAVGLVISAHVSGEDRFSPRKRLVAHTLVESGLATLLLDLLTAPEELQDESTGHLRRDVGLLGERLSQAIAWIGAAEEAEELAELPLGCLGAEVAAAAVLAAAAQQQEVVAAAVLRSGALDLVPGAVLGAVRAPTLLVVGTEDPEGGALARAARERMPAETGLESVAGASRDFGQPGTLERWAELAADWFGQHLPAPPGRR